jgi:hypothetical protein
MMVPYLERTLDLSREYSSFFAPCGHVADPHIDDADEGMTAALISRLFNELKGQLVPMVRAICEQPAADDASLRQAFPKAAQFEFALHAAKSLGYDLRRGRLDLTRTGIPVTSAVDSRAMRSAIFYPPSSIGPRSRRIRASCTKSRRVNLGLCTLGCAITFTGTAASLRQTILSSAPRALDNLGLQFV